MAPRAAKGNGSISQAANGSWRGYVTVDGKRRTFTASTKQEADQKRRDLMKQRDSGRLSTGKIPTLNVWLERWLEIRNHKPSTAAGYRQSIRLYIQPAIGHLRLDKLNPEHVEDLLAGMAKKGISGSGRHQTYSIIRASLAEAARRGHVQRNVAAIISAPKVPKVKAKSLSDGDVDAILAAATGTPLEARWHLSLLLGLRPGEVTGLEWKDVDLKKGQLHVRQQLQQNRDLGLIIVETPKSTAGDRVIPLPAYLIDMLRKHRKNEAKKLLELGDRRIVWSYQGHTPSFVFTMKHGQPLRPRDDDDVWRDLLAKAKVPFTRRYTARHTAASSMIASAIDVATVSETLGHHSPGFTMSTYVHSIDERKVGLADMIDRRITSTGV
ncbi:tyrosine-type recombinase/integrase [Arthrobacter sp. UYCo732]|uniref:site-specific integrase n=1 Tax=Arthrobacter sp. UYCo732 TaxID=3156336 RepID=UPI0033932E50